MKVSKGMVNMLQQKICLRNNLQNMKPNNFTLFLFYNLVHFQQYSALFKGDLKKHKYFKCHIFLHKNKQ